MMNLADPLFLIISLSPIMSSGTENCVPLSLSLSFHLLIFSIFPRCLLAVSLLSFSHSSSILDELICHFSFNVSLLLRPRCLLWLPCFSLSLSLSLCLFSYRSSSFFPLFFLGETESRRCSRILLFLRFTVGFSVSFSFLPLPAQVWSLFLSKRFREELDWSVCECECACVCVCVCVWVLAWF